MKNNPRKLDWRPLTEWRRRHPEITVTEIAKALGKSRSYVSMKLSEAQIS
jgi:hypothetical protein